MWKQGASVRHNLQCATGSTWFGVFTPNPPINVFWTPGVPNSIVDATCFDVADGEIYVVAIGGSNLGFEFSVDGINYAPSPISVSGGTFSVMARDSEGCMAPCRGSRLDRSN